MARSVKRGLLSLAGGILLCAWALRPAIGADLRIFSPVVEPGQTELGESGSTTRDRRQRQNDQQAHFAELGYGVTEYWRTEIEGHWETGEDGVRFRSVDNENIFHLLSADRYWADVALLAEFDASVDGGTPHFLTLGPLFQKQIGRSLTTLDIFFDRQFGHGATYGTTLRYLGRSIWQTSELISPALEIYGEFGRIGRFGKLASQDHRIGPALTGALDLPGIGPVGYDVGYLFGATPNAPSGTIEWRFEFDVRF